jgi:hypothetical protein
MWTVSSCRVGGDPPGPLPSSSEHALRIVATATAAMVDTTRMARNLINSGIPDGTDVHARIGLGFGVTDPPSRAAEDLLA